MQFLVKRREDCAQVPTANFSLQRISMFPRRPQDAKTSFEIMKFLSKRGFGKEDYHFLKHIGKALLCTYTIFGAVWLYGSGKSPLDWWMPKPRPKEEKELAHLYEQRESLHTGGEEATKELIAKGGFSGTIGPKEVVEPDKEEAKKLWFRLRNEVRLELRAKGYDVE